jgi:hypothetical protein
MKTRKGKPANAETPSPKPQSDPLSTAANPVEMSNDSPEKPNRISFNLTVDGKPDFARMQGKTKAQLIELLQNKSVQKELGFSADEAKRIEEIGFGEDEANGLLDLVGGINSIAASRIYKIPREVTSPAFHFTPDHRKKINPGLTRILNKWGPAILKTWKDEIGLGIVMVSVLNSQIALMHIYEARRVRANTPQPVPSKVTPISEPAPTEEKPVEKEPAVTDTVDLNA